MFFSCPLAQSALSWLQSLMFLYSSSCPSLVCRHVLFGFAPSRTKRPVLDSVSYVLILLLLPIPCLSACTVWVCSPWASFFAESFYTCFECLQFFPCFSPMISTLVFPPIPGTLAPSVANHRLTSDPLGRLFAVVLVSHYNSFPASMFRSCFCVVFCRFLKYVLSCFPFCCFSLFFMYERGKFRFLGDFWRTGAPPFKVNHWSLWTSRNVW